jgi:phosphate transport system permease protein
MHLYRRRRLVNGLFLSLSMLAVVVGLAFLSWILAMVVLKGWPGLSLQLFRYDTPGPGMAEGGLRNAMVGSLMMNALAILVASPIGLLAGTYLAEYGRYTRLADGVRFINDVLLSSPSIIIGLFVYELAVAPFGGFSGWAGAIALAIIVVPVVLQTTETMLRLVPDTLREACAAMGAPRHVMITRIAYRAAMNGMITGILLAFARISGETAPLLFTALGNQYWSIDLSKPMPNLPVVIFNFANSSFENWQVLAWSGALVITAVVLLLSIAARVLASSTRKA